MPYRHTFTCVLAFALAPAGAGHATAQESPHTHDDGGHGHAGLHFSHPMIAESVTPDRKIRVGYARFEVSGLEHENSARIAGEWAFHRAFSVEVSAPYSFTQTEFGFTHLAAKFANYAFEEHGLLLGYGLGVGIPTAGDSPAEAHGHGEEEGGGHTHGTTRATRISVRPGARSPLPPGLGVHANGSGTVRSDLGHEFWELEPFLNAGWKTGLWELVAFTTYSIPASAAEAAVTSHLRYNVSALYHVNSRLQGLLEFDGVTDVNEDAGAGEHVSNLSPGLKVRVFEGRSLFFGGAVSFPLTNAEAFDTRVRVSVFQHF